MQALIRLPILESLQRVRRLNYVRNVSIKNMKLLSRTNLESLFVYCEYTTSQMQCQHLIRKSFRKEILLRQKQKRLKIAQPQTNRLRLPGTGAEPQQAETHPFRERGMDGFCAFVLQMHCLLVLCQIWCKSRKQCLCRTICEKRAFPLRRICAFSAF